MELKPAPALEVGFYRPSESFQTQPEHVAVMRSDNGGLVAITGYSDYREQQNFVESLAEAAVFSAAWDMLKLVSAVARDESSPLSIAASAILAELPRKFNAMYSLAPDCDLQGQIGAAIQLMGHRAGKGIQTE